MKTQFISAAKAIKHLVKKFNRCKAQNKPFYISDYDTLCLNNIAAYHDRNTQKKPYEYSLLSKMILFLMIQVCLKYKTHIFDPVVDRYICAILEKPMDVHLHEFTQGLNDSDMFMLLEELDPGNDKHPALRDPERQKEILNNLTDEQYKRLTQKPFDFETAKYIALEKITNAINRFSNASQG